MKVYLKKWRPDAKIPKQTTEYAGGWDVTATSIEHCEDESVICHLGFALQLPPNYMMRISPRSSLTKTGWIIQNSPGLCDPDYFGEYQVRFRAISQAYKALGFPYKAGDRVAQCYLEEIIPIEFEEVKELHRIGNRNDAGYGSTGLHEIPKRD